MNRRIALASLYAAISLYPAAMVHAEPAAPQLDEAKKLVRCSTLISVIQNLGEKTPAEKLVLIYYSIALASKAEKFGATKELKAEWTAAAEKDVKDAMGWSIEARRAFLMGELDICKPALEAEAQAYKENSRARREGIKPATPEAVRQ